MNSTTDIDIDFADRTAALEKLPHIDASLVTEQGRTQRHPSSVYFQDIPVDPLTGLASFNFRETSSRGYFKIDFLNNSIYEGVRDEDHLVDLLTCETDWSLLEHREIVERLAHISGHFGIVQAISPRGIEDLAVVIALIRPAKRHLASSPRAIIYRDIWKHEDNGDYAFKKAHAVAFAASIVVQLNLIIEKTAAELEDESSQY